MKVVDNMAIDSHMHINSMVLRDIEAINKSHSIKSVVNVGLNIETSKESVLISKKNSKSVIHKFTGCRFFIYVSG